MAYKSDDMCTPFYLVFDDQSNYELFLNTQFRGHI
jgi:hypothetical protein